MARAACARAWPAGWRRRWRLLARRAGFQGRRSLRAPVGTAAAPLRHTFVAPPLSWRFFKRLSSPPKAELLPASLQNVPCNVRDCVVFLFCVRFLL